MIKSSMRDIVGNTYNMKNRYQHLLIYNHNNLAESDFNFKRHLYTRFTIVRNWDVHYN